MAGPPPSGADLQHILLNLVAIDSGTDAVIRQTHPKPDTVFTENVQARAYRLSAVYPCGRSARLAGADLLKGTAIPDQRDRRDLYKTATIDQDGRFTIRSLPPGNYKVFAWEDLEPFAYYDAELLRRYQQLGRPVTIGESSSENIQVKIIPAGM